MKARLCWSTVATLVGAAVLASVAAGAFDRGLGADASCPAGSKPAVVGGNFKCLRVGQPCKARYQSAYRRYGFTCADGRLRKRTTKPAPTPPSPPPPSPPPAPTPPAQPGHYHGTTSQLEVIDMDVLADGSTVTNIRTGQINQGCTPPGHISGGGLQNATRNLTSDGSFIVDFAYSGSFSDGTPYSGHFNLTGRFSGGSASGTLSVTLNFVANGTAYACGSGVQTWTASRTSL